MGSHFARVNLCHLVALKLASMKLDYQILILLFASFAALAFQYFVPRIEQVEYRSDGWEVSSVSSGKGSASSAKVTENGAEMRCRVVDRGPNPFAGIRFTRPSGENAVSLDWVEKLKLTASLDGPPNSYFRMYVRNQIPGVYDPTDEQSQQYNEVAFKLTNEPQTLVFDCDQFHVPSWWAEKYGTRFEHSMAQFDRVDSVELISGHNVRSKKLRLIVKKIEFCGYWVPPFVLYRTLLASWLTMGFGVVLQKFIEFRKQIGQAKERETRLRLINVSLESQASKLTKIAHRDGLTGLLNRLGLRKSPRLLPEALEASIPVSLIIFDIDHFKMINDSRGHNFGDKVLADVGKVLHENAAADELIARWGGEEFLVVCFEALDRADRAMYHAKFSGRNQVVAFSHLPAKEQSEWNAEEIWVGVENA